ncbi:hypothetical protein MKW92_008477, partial [Papaver armeniacum]
DSPAFEKYPIIERIARFIDFVDKSGHLSFLNVYSIVRHWRRGAWKWGVGVTL